MKKIALLACALGILVSATFYSSCTKLSKATVTPATPSKTRVYYIAAETVLWDFAPQGYNVFMGMPYDAADSVFAVNLPTGPTPRIGSRNYAARYIEYTDSTFSTPKPVDSAWQHLGILGPVIRAVVGDSVVIYFKNRTNIHATIHVHGLEYSPDNEGAFYANGSVSAGNDVEPGGKYTYRLLARDASGPAANQPSSVVWLYHSHYYMDERDLYAGLVGGIIVTKKGMADENAKPVDVDREFITMFFIFNQNASALLDSSIHTFCPGFTNPDPDDFEESNKKHTINGMLMGNLPGLTMNKGERVRWYLLALGNEVDLHTPHWHGNTVMSNGVNTDVIDLLPANMLVADMVPDNAGIWGYHCHVTDHMMAGMTALYTVR